MSEGSSELPPVTDLDRTAEVLRSGRFDRLTVRQARELIDSDTPLDRVPVPIRYYFGCVNRPGHYMHGAQRHGMSNVRWRPGELVPWRDVDGGLAPKNGAQGQGEAALHHKDGWTALAFWDRSVDTRGGSNSAFFFNSTLSFEEALADAEKHFPAVFDRLTFEVVDVTHA